MGTHFTRVPKIKRAPTKTTVFVWMPQTAMEKSKHFTDTLRRYGNWITVSISRCLYFGANGEADRKRGNKKSVWDDNG